MNDSKIQYQNYLKKVFFAFVLLMVLQMGYSQNGDDGYGNYDDNFNLPYHTPNTTFASPDVTAFGKYVDIPVSLYTGVPEISIPLYEIKTTNLSIPINLSYHSSGIKVEEVASWVGLGWSLNAGGMISRSVRGLQDDRKDNGGVKDENGTPYYGDHQNITGYLYSGEEIYNFCNGTSSLDKREMWELSHGAWDGEPDVFNFNFLNYTGKFVFDHNGEVHFFEKNDLKIDYFQDAEGLLIKFIITTEDGTIVIFEDIESSTKIQGRGQYDDNYFGFNAVSFMNLFTSISAWKISKIISPNSQDTIKFIYDPEEVSTLKKGREERRVYDYTAYSKKIYNDRFEFISKRLRQINWNNGRLEFKANLTREDYDLYLSEYHEPDSKALTAIELYDNQDNLIRSFNFSHSYFYSSTIDDEQLDYLIGYSKRLRLDKIQTSSPSSNKINEYTFEYNSSTMPHRFSYEQDYWGYYNANHTNGLNSSKTLIPNLYEYPYDGGINDIYNSKYLSPFSVFLRSNYSSYIYHANSTNSVFHSANRVPNSSVIQACILTKITYPTGGSAEYIYEPNDFYLDEQNITGGGLRIQKTILKNNIDPQKNIIKEYYYHNTEDNSISSGRIIYLPQFAKHSRSFGENEYVSYSTSQGGLGDTHGNHVGYNEVKVIHENNGMVISKFSMPATFGESTAYCNEGSCIFNRTISEYNTPPNIANYFNKSNYPFPPDPNIDWARGQLVEEITYNKLGEIIKKLENEYENKEYHIIPALFVKSAHIDVSSYYPPPSYSQYAYKSGKYYYISSWRVLSKKTITNYFNNAQNNLPIVTEYFYDSPSHKMQTKKTRINSDGSVNSITYEYPPDVTPSEVFTPPVVVNTMNLKNIIAPVMKSELFNGTNRIDGSITSFDNFDPLYYYLPNATYSLVGDVYEKKSNFDSYDSEGNILQFHEEYGTNNTYYWCFNNQYPIVMANNVTYSELSNAISTTQPDIELFMQGLGDLSEESQRTALKTFITALQSALPDAFVSIYTYIPLIGMTSETDLNGNTIIYIYDEFGRLETIRDIDNNVLKHVDYNYFEPILEVSPESFIIENDGGTFQVDISSNVPWVVTENSDFLSLIPPTEGNCNGSFQFYCPENTDIINKPAEITVEGNNLSKTISITQLAADHILVSDVVIDLIPTGTGGQSITIKSNVDWTATYGGGNNFFTFSPSSNSGYETSMFISSGISFPDNQYGEIILSGNDISVTIQVTQAAKP